MGTDADGKPIFYEVYWVGYKRAPSKEESLAGVAFLVRKSKFITVEDVNFELNARMMTITVLVYGIRYFFVNNYMYTESANRSKGSTTEEFQKKSELHIKKKDRQYQLLRKTIKSRPQKSRLIVLGDFNATSTVASTFTRHRGNNNILDTHTANDNGTRMLDFVRQFDLAVLNSYWKHKRSHMITWHSATGFKNTIDYILSDGLLSSWCTNCRVRNSFDFLSDHRLLVLTVRQPKTKRDFLHHRPKKPASDPIKSRRVKDLRNKPEYPKIVDKFLVDEAAYIPQDISHKCEFLTYILKKATIQCLPEEPKQSKTLPWQDNPELDQLQAQRDTMSRSDPMYKKLTKQHRKILTKLKNQYHADEAAAINSYAVARDIERTFQRMKAEALQDVPSTGCDPNLLRQFFKKHYTCDTSKPVPDSLYQNPPEFMEALLTVSREIEVKTHPPDSNEIKLILSKFKNGKAANDIPPELLKYARDSPEFLKILTEIMTDLWTNFNIPTEWALSRLSCLYKNKGSKKDPKMYRGLSISSSLCKLAVCIILARHHQWYEAQLSEPQQGFRSNRGTQDAILTVKSLQQITSRMKIQVYSAFVDLTAAFDTIQRSWLFKILRQRFGDDNNSNANISVLEALYSKTSAHLDSDEVELAFETIAGVRQGGPESPSLFCLLMDWVMRIFEIRAKKMGLKGVELKYRIATSATNRAERSECPSSGLLNLLWVAFADDINLNFTSEEDLIKGLDLLTEIFDEFDLHMSEKKTETMILNAECSDEDYPTTLHTIHDIELKNVKVFKYLGSKIQYDQPGTGDTEIDSRINLAKGKFETLKYILCNHKIHKWIRMKFYNAFIRSRLTYACQTWTLTKQQANSLDSAHAHFLRRMTKSGFRRRISDSEDEISQKYVYYNTDLFKFFKSGPVSTYIDKQRQKFAAHIIRQPNSRHTKQLMFNDNKYKKAGQRTGSLLEQSVKNHGTDTDQFIRAARKREF